MILYSGESLTLVIIWFTFGPGDELFKVLKCDTCYLLI